MLFDIIGIRYILQVNQVQADNEGHFSMNSFYGYGFLFYFIFILVLHTVVERYSGSQGELLSQNRWSVSQEESRDADR